MARHIHIDPFNGIAGDMLLAGLVHLGAPAEPIERALRAIPFPGASSLALSFPEVSSHGVSGRRMEVVLPERAAAPSRTYRELRGWLQDASVPVRAKEVAGAVLACVGRAEAEAHGVPLEDVHFRELGGFDTVIDLLGTAMALVALDVGSLSCGPLPLSLGQIRRDDGVLPSPAPATAAILRGILVRGSDVAGEIVTPTGAALAVTLAAEFGPVPPMTLHATGAGFGTSGFSDRPNCLRLFLGERPDVGAGAENLWLLEANLDDLSAELLAPLPQLCLDAGALDAWLSPALMKKGRPAHVLHALCPSEARGAVEAAMFRHSSTLGVRRQPAERTALARTWQESPTPWGPVKVKIGWLGGEAVNRSPEFEDCRRVAEAAGVPLKEVYIAALAGSHTPRAQR